jgi:hypothetical protein
MFKNSCASARKQQTARPRLGHAFALVALLAAAGCEDKGIGRPCDITQDAGAAQGAYNTNATDCPSRMCIKPNVQPGISNDLDTTSYCSARCSSDSDCDGQTRDPTNPDDTRCRKGYTCASVFGKGPLCCAKLCLCRDFFSASVGPAVPAECKSDSDASCS